MNQFVLIAILTFIAFALFGIERGIMAVRTEINLFKTAIEKALEQNKPTFTATFKPKGDWDGAHVVDDNNAVRTKPITFDDYKKAYERHKRKVIKK